MPCTPRRRRRRCQQAASWTLCGSLSVAREVICLRMCSVATSTTQVVPSLDRPTPSLPEEAPPTPPPSNRPPAQPRTGPTREPAGAAAACRWTWLAHTRYTHVPCSPTSPTTHTSTEYTRYHAQPLSASHSFLPPVSLFRTSSAG